MIVLERLMTESAKRWVSQVEKDEKGKTYKLFLNTGKLKIIKAKDYLQAVKACGKNGFSLVEFWCYGDVASSYKWVSDKWKKI